MSASQSLSTGATPSSSLVAAAAAASNAANTTASGQFYDEVFVHPDDDEDDEGDSDEEDDEDDDDDAHVFDHEVDGDDFGVRAESLQPPTIMESASLMKLPTTDSSSLTAATGSGKTSDGDGFDDDDDFGEFGGGSFGSFDSIQASTPGALVTSTSLASSSPSSSDFDEDFADFQEPEPRSAPAVAAVDDHVVVAVNPEQNNGRANNVAVPLFKANFEVTQRASPPVATIAATTTTASIATASSLSNHLLHHPQEIEENPFVSFETPDTSHRTLLSTHLSSTSSSATSMASAAEEDAFVLETGLPPLSSSALSNSGSTTFAKPQERYDEDDIEDLLHDTPPFTSQASEGTPAKAPKGGYGAAGSDVKQPRKPRKKRIAPTSNAAERKQMITIVVVSVAALIVGAVVIMAVMGTFGNGGPSSAGHSQPSASTESLTKSTGVGSAKAAAPSDGKFGLEDLGKNSISSHASESRDVGSPTTKPPTKSSGASSRSKSSSYSTKSSSKPSKGYWPGGHSGDLDDPDEDDDAPPYKSVKTSSTASWSAPAPSGFWIAETGSPNTGLSSPSDGSVRPSVSQTSALVSVPSASSTASSDLPSVSPSASFSSADSLAGIGSNETISVTVQPSPSSAGGSSASPSMSAESSAPTELVSSVNATLTTTVTPEPSLDRKISTSSSSSKKGTKSKSGKQTSKIDSSSTSKSTSPGTKTASASPVGSTPSSAPSSSALPSVRCGVSWAKASVTCGTPCPGLTDGECPHGQTCYADLPTQVCMSPTSTNATIAVPTVTPSLPTFRCGSSWTKANQVCGLPCPKKDDVCPENESCWADLSTAPCASKSLPTYRCGINWAKANEVCGISCTNKDDKCPENESCWADLSISPCAATANATVSSASVANLGPSPTSAITVSPSPTGSASQSRCGVSWAAADANCGEPCPAGLDEECPVGQKCFADLGSMVCSKNETSYVPFVPRNFTKPGVIAYWTNWSVYSRKQNGLEKLNFTGVSAVNYAFFSLDANGKVISYDPEVDSVQVPLLNRKVREANPSLLSVASIGGWSKSTHFSTVLKSNATATAFVKNIKKFLNINRFDGVDIDFEYPGGGGLSSNSKDSSDALKFARFLVALRNELGPNRLLSIAVSADPTPFINSTGGESPATISEMIANSVSYIQVMSYDFAGPWSSITDMQAPLKIPAVLGAPKSRLTTPPSSASEAVARWSATKEVSELHDESLARRDSSLSPSSSSSSSSLASSSSSTVSTSSEATPSASSSARPTDSAQSASISSSISNGSGAANASSSSAASASTSGRSSSSSPTPSPSPAPTPLRMYLTAAIPVWKIVLGVPFYGHSWSPQSAGPSTATQPAGFHQPCAKAGQSDIAPTPCKPIPGDPLDVDEAVHTGIWMYLNLRGAAAASFAAPASQLQFPLNSTVTTDGARTNWTRTYLPEYEAPVLYNPAYVPVNGKGAASGPAMPVFISYDDVVSVEKKAQWAKSTGLGGVMAWEVTQDFNGELLDALVKGFA